MIELTPEDMSFAKRQAFRLSNQWGAYCSQDILDAANEGLGRAAVKYKLEYGDFRKFAFFVIRASIVQYYRDLLGKTGQKKIFEESKEPFNDNSFELSNDGLENRVIAKDLCFKFKNELGKKYKCRSQIKRFDLLVAGYTNKDIAGLDNITAQAVSDNFKKIRLKFQRFLADNNICVLN